MLSHDALVAIEIPRLFACFWRLEPGNMYTVFGMGSFEIMALGWIGSWMH